LFDDNSINADDILEDDPDHELALTESERSTLYMALCLLEDRAAAEGDTEKQHEASKLANRVSYFL